MKIKFIVLSLFVTALAYADTYQVSYSWTPVEWTTPVSPTYGIQFRIGSNEPVITTDTANPEGFFYYAANPGDILYACPQNKNNNGTTSVPTCALTEHWITVGASPASPTEYPNPAGFGTTIVHTGN